jgi:preprotein translocase subunit YajC
MRLVLQNTQGQTVRTFDVEGDEAVLIQRHDTRRVELHASVARLESRRVKFEKLADVRKEAIEKNPIAIAQVGRLEVYKEITHLVADQKNSPEHSRGWWGSLAAMLVFMAGFLIFVLNRPASETAKVEQEMKSQLVKIVKQIQVKTQPVVQANVPQVKEAQNVKATKKTASIKRMGALSVLGSLKSGKQQGGVNLGAVQTTAGPGLGGNAGSGGVQRSLYGKGLVAAPVGAGSNMQGGGGYGTKGKGGGQAGYGNLSLVGSSGSAPIPLGREALVEGGLDRDLISDVINRNMGQVRFCYEQGLQGDPALAGRVAIGFTIGGNGIVRVAGVESTTLNSKLVEECIVMRLRSWKFPLPTGGVDVKVSFPFVLRRAGQG